MASAAVEISTPAGDAKRRSDSAGASKVGFLLTEVDVESPAPVSPVSPAAASSTASAVEKAKSETSIATVPGTMNSVYRVQDTEVPIEAIGDQSMSAPLPDNINMEHVMTNIKQNLDLKAWVHQDHAQNTWFKDFKSPPSRAVISDTFWFCICWYFKTGQHSNLERALFDRISVNFVALFNLVPPARKDFFFRCYADAVAQAVLYSMFLAYPKSRVHFTEKFRKDLIIRISHWTTGVCPEFVDASHWKLNLGGGDVLQSTSSQSWPRGGQLGDGSRGGTSGQSLLSFDSLAGRRTSLAHRAPRPLRTLRYSPLVAHFLKSRKYSSVNLVRATRMSMTTAEERARLMDMKHKLLVEKATEARQNCDAKVQEYTDLCNQSRREERLYHREAQTAKKRLEIRRKEVLRSDPHEYANYLVSLHLLQQGHGV